jgi:anthranilate synthase component 1
VKTLKTPSSFLQFQAAAEKGNLIPVHQELLADTETPVSVYMKIKDSRPSYLLESAEGGENWGRYSFIGFDPFITVTLNGSRMEIQRDDEVQVIDNLINPLETLRTISNRYRPSGTEELPRFHGGLVGFCDYELISRWEDLPQLSASEDDRPQSVFTASKRLIIFDHLKHTMRIVAFAHVDENTNLEQTYRDALTKVNDTVDLLMEPLPRDDLEKPFSVSDLKSNFGEANFKDAVRRAKEFIAAGDVIQVVLSQKFSGEITGTDFTLYRHLRSVNPSPYMFYLDFGATRLIGASPEVLVRLTDRHVELKPIAGTRARGENPEADEALKQELLADPKERAEHIMLVDLGRNDVGKVALPGSVTVPRLMEVERYSHVMHLVSKVEGQLKPDMDSFDLFMSAFPAGTVTGAPKIRAMEIIHDLEPEPRGPYAGAVGYFSFNGDMDFCITIRTITIHHNRLSIQVGAGIVADSSPEGEYQETLKKAGAMFRTLERADNNDPSDR